MIFKQLHSPAACPVMYGMIVRAAEADMYQTNRTIAAYMTASWQQPSPVAIHMTK